MDLFIRTDNRKTNRKPSDFDWPWDCFSGDMGGPVGQQERYSVCLGSLPWEEVDLELKFKGWWGDWRWRGRRGEGKEKKEGRGIAGSGNSMGKDQRLERAECLENHPLLSMTEMKYYGLIWEEGLASGQTARASQNLQSDKDFYPDHLADLLKNFEQESDMIRIAF